MSSSRHLKEFIRERLTAAAEEIFSEFEKNILQYEERIRLLDIYWKPRINLHRVDLLQQHVSMEEEDDVSAEPLVCNKETSSCLDQEKPQPPWIKQEQLEYWSSQQEDEAELKEETNKYLMNPCEEDLPQQRACMEEEAPTDHLLWDKESGNSDQDLEEAEPLQVKEELGELWGSGEELEAQEGTNGFMPTPRYDSEQCTSFLQTSISDQIPEACFEPLEEFYAGKDVEQSYTAEQKIEVKHYNNNMDFAPLSETDIMFNVVKKPIKCGFCDKTFQFKSRLNRHMVTHTGKFTCGVCEKSFSQYSQLTQHMRTDTCGGKPVDQHSGSVTHTREKPFVCSTCGKRFTRAQILKRHTSLHTGERPFSCDTCGKSFSRKDHLLNHMKTHRGRTAYVSSSFKTPRIPSKPPAKQAAKQAAKPVAPELYSCEKCGKRFRYHQSYLIHLDKHWDDSSFTCQTCGKHFTQFSRLKRHELIHSGAKPFTCGMCGKSLSRRDHLLRHMKIHGDLNACV